MVATSARCAPASVARPRCRWRSASASGRSPAARCIEVYGMTEASGLIAIDPVAGRGGTGSVGWAVALHPGRGAPPRGQRSLGEPCDAGEVGVITVRGPTCRRAIAIRRTTRASSKTACSTPATSVTPTSTGRIHIAGRAKDLIIRSGHNIDPVMIENAMARHPAVALAAAVGMPDDYAGELPVCYVALRPVQRHATPSCTSMRSARLASDRHGRSRSTSSRRSRSPRWARSTSSAARACTAGLIVRMCRSTKSPVSCNTRFGSAQIRHLWIPCQWVRMPGGTREGGSRQHILYFRPLGDKQ